MQVTFTKTHGALPMGIYHPTDIDMRKAAADFRLLDVSCRLKRIQWRDGRMQEVTSRELTKLQAAHTWATDF